MFTGLVSDVGRVVSVEGSERLRRIVIESAYDPAGIALGASIACSGDVLENDAMSAANSTNDFDIVADCARPTPNAWNRFPYVPTASSADCFD